MPAVTPAEVHTRPSRTKIGSGSTATRGCIAREPRRERPVGGRAAPVEQAGAREQEGARAHRGGAPRARGRARDPADQRLVLARGLVSRAARDDSVSSRPAAPPVPACGTMRSPLEVSIGAATLPITAIS